MTTNTTTTTEATATRSDETTANGGVPATAPTDGPQIRRKPPEYGLSRKALAELKRESVDDFLLAEFGEGVRGYDLPRLSELRRLTHHILAMRKENVAAIADDEMFTVRLPNGKQLVRVTHRIQLSIARKELFQIPKGRVRDDGTRAVAEPGIAQLTVPGYDAINRVAGCSVALPPTIQVDGKDRENPYVERYEDTGTTTGDIRRIVICVVVAGMSQIGTPVVVRYTYEYEPGKEFLHALGKLAVDCDWKTKARTYEGVVEIVARDDFQAFVESQADKRARWKYVPMFSGVGYACNLAHPAVMAVYVEMLQVSKEAGKKAITVARRNAMRAHPALSRGAVEIDQATGKGFTTVTGWTASRDAVRDYHALMADLARGISADLRGAADAGVEVVDRVEVFDPETETIDAMDEEDIAKAAAKEDDDVRDAEAAMQQRNELIDAIRAAADDITNPNIAQEMLAGLDVMSIDDLSFRLDAANSYR